MKVQVIYWRDIPVKVRVKNGRSRLTTHLSPRFQKTVYRAAFRAKAINGQAYTDSWRTSNWRSHEDDADTTINHIAAAIEAAYSDERLDKLAHSKGNEENKPDDDKIPDYILA